MVTGIRIYYEGAPQLRLGFHAFLKEIRILAEGRSHFHLISMGANFIQYFEIAIKRHPDALNVFLVDSEGPLKPDQTVTFCGQMHWDKAYAQSIFWMVQMMESWFYADKNALQRFYGPGFNLQALKRNPKVEQIAKKDLWDGLRDATKDTRKGRYHKTEHAPKLLALIDPQRSIHNSSKQAAPNCRRLFETLKKNVA